MANITVKIIPEDNLTVFTVEGDLSADEILNYCTEHYEKKPTKNVLWDATKGSISKIKNSDFSRIAIDMKNHTEKRAGGKTALVGKFDIDFGFARMYEAYADLEDIPISYQVFRNLDDAMKWLQL